MEQVDIAAGVHLHSISTGPGRIEGIEWIEIFWKSMQSALELEPSVYDALKTPGIAVLPNFQTTSNQVDFQ